MTDVMAKNVNSKQNVSLRIKVRIGDVVIGPGKIELLKRIDEAGGISAAARAMGMSYRRAWHLIDTISSGLSEPIVETNVGGSGGGGAALTPLGRRLVDDYEAAIRAADEAAIPALSWLDEAAEGNSPDTGSHD